MTTAKQIAIVGAGLIGRLAAFELDRQGYQVTLYDSDKRCAKNSAAYAAAGLLTPLGEAFHSPANIVAMGFESLKLWPEIINGLDEHVFFQQQGAIMVSHEQDKGDFQHHARYLNRYHSNAHIQTLNRQQLEQLEPELGRSFNQGLYLPDEGQVGNRRLLIALRKQIESSAIIWRDQHKVIEISQNNVQGSITAQSNTEESTQQFDFIIDCRGVGAKQSNDAKSGISDLRAVRGELFQLFAPQVNINRPIRLMHPRYQLYIAPKSKGYYVVGATEIESDDDSPMTVRSAMELLSAAYSVHPGFAEANIRQHVSQTRPAFSDNQPKISLNNRLVQVNGLYRHGFLIAPVVLKQLVELTNQWVSSCKLPSNQRNHYLAQQTFSYADLLAISVEGLPINTLKAQAVV